MTEVVAIKTTKALPDALVERLREVITQIESGDITMFVACYLSKDGLDHDATYFYLYEGPTVDKVTGSTLLQHRILDLMTKD